MACIHRGNAGEHLFAHANMGFLFGRSHARSSTRVPCKIPATLTSLDPHQPLSDACLIILVNPQGCAARFYHPLMVGTAVRLLGLPANISVTAKVVNCISIGSEKLWLLGLALDEPGDVWGIQSPPEDWALS